MHTIINKNINLSNYKSNNKEFNELINSQFKEIYVEKEISNNIKMVGKINDLISKKVKDQYEINPYPRWKYNSYANDKKINFISIINSEIYPNSINPGQI